MNEKSTIKQLINPDEYYKWGSWANSNFFIGLWLDNIDKLNYKNELKINFAQNKMIVIDHDYYATKVDSKKFEKQTSKHTLKHLKDWNTGCLQIIKALDNHSKCQINKPYAKFSNKDLISQLKTLEKFIRPYFIYLSSYPLTADVIEKYYVKKLKHIKFEEISPLYKISSEKIRDALKKATNENDIKKIKENFGWFGLNLLRGNPLTVSTLKRYSKSEKSQRKLIQSKNQTIRQLQLFIWLKFERIDACNRLFYSYLPLFKEITKRLNRPFKYFEIMFAQELRSALITGNLPKNLKDRFKYRGVVNIGKSKFHINKKQFIELKSLFNSKVSNHEFLKGKVACKGIVKGYVKVVKKPNEIKKIKKDDVLVTHETLAEQEPYLVKAKAMIVENGSLLCHSAIFAREFNIPTIVGVSDATKIFKDGDYVLVDANKGIVRKIK